MLHRLDVSAPPTLTKPMRTRPFPRAAFVFVTLAAAMTANAASITGTFTAISAADAPFNLTALGPADWACWSPATGNAVSGAPTNRKAGATLIGSATPVGGGNLRGSTSTTRPLTDFSFTDGTAPAAGTETNAIGVFNSQLKTSGAGVAVAVALPTAEPYAVRLFVGNFSAVGVVTATLPGASFTDNSFQGVNPPAAKYSGYYTFTVVPDNPNDVLTLSAVSTTNTVDNSHVLINGVAVSAAPDPMLVKDAVNGAPDLHFGTLLLAPGAPVELPARTVRFNNAGISQDILINSVAITHDATGSFAVTAITRNGTPQTPPFSLNPGDHLQVTVQGTPARTAGAALTATLAVTTDVPAQDQNLPVSAAVYAEGDLLNANPLFEQAAAGHYAAQWSPEHVRGAPGLAHGSGHLVRVVGKGDPDLLEVGDANQSAGIVNNVTHFESVFHFAPAAASEFPGYTGQGTSPDGQFGDRSLQYLILSNDTDVRDGFTLDAGETGNILVNLAYFPDGVSDGGTPGFYVFNADTPGWELALAVTLPGSVDADSDGMLDPAAGDTVHAYRVAVKGTDFGSPAASYTIEVSSPVTHSIAGTLASPPLTAWHGASGEVATLAAHSFTTGDRSESNPNGGYCVPFWLDEAALHYVAQPDPLLTVLAAPATILIDRDATPTGAASMSIRNDGGSNNLTIAAIAADDGSFTLDPAPSLPLVLVPGGTATLDLAWDPAASAPDTAAAATLSLASNAAGSPATANLLAGAYSNASLFPNGTFEAPGADPTTDLDTFAFWNEGATVTDLVPGLVAGSSTAALLAPNAILNANFGRRAAAWRLDCLFAVRATADRAFNVKVRQFLGGTAPEVNLRYQQGVWAVFDSPQNNWMPVIDMSAAPLTPSAPGALTPYRLRLTGAGWNTPAPTFQLEVLAADGTPLAASAPGLTWFQSGPPTDGAGGIEFNSTQGSSPGFWVDDTSVALVAAGPGVVITGLAGGPGGFTIHYDAGGAAVNVERAGPDLNFSDIATGVTAGTFTDSTAPAGSAFYRIYIP